MTDRITLADAITDLRAEIQDAMDRAHNQKLRLHLESIEMELQVTTGKSTGIEGKMTAWFVEVGGKRSADSGQTHTLRLKLTPEVVLPNQEDEPRQRTGRVNVAG